MNPRERSFDYEQAARRYRGGESVKKLAAEYGVTTQMVYMAIRKINGPIRETAARLTVPVKAAEPVVDAPPTLAHETRDRIVPRALPRTERLTTQRGPDDDLLHARYPSATRTLCDLVAVKLKKGWSVPPTCERCIQTAHAFHRIDHASCPAHWNWYGEKAA